MVTIAVLTSVGQTLDAFFPEIIAEWERIGHNVVTASSTESTVGAHTVLDDLSRKPSLRNVRARAAIANWLIRTHADVLITNTAVASFLARSGKQPCPVIYFCHGLHWNRGTGIGEKLWQRLERMALKHTDAVITINGDDQRWFSTMAPGLPQMRLAAGVGLDLEKYPYKEPRHTSRGPSLIWIGEFSERKRPELAIDAVKALSAFSSTVSLTMCGQGRQLGRVQEAVEASALQGKVRLLGQRQDIPALIAASDALVITSTWEGLPRVALEALAIGRPVIGYDVKGVRSVPGVHLANEGDTDALAKLVLVAVDSQANETAGVREALDVKVAAFKIQEFALDVLA